MGQGAWAGFWTDEHDASLRKHIEAGMSFSWAAAAINEEHGTDYSRNAAIGRASRIGLAQPTKVRPIASKSVPDKRFGPMPRRAPKLRKPVQRERHSNITGALMHKPEANALEAATRPLRIADVVPLHLNLLDLEPGQCRWPFGDGPFTFCGCEQFGGSSYCEPHDALAQGQGSRGEQMAHRIHKAA